MLGLPVPPKLRAKLDAKAARKFEAAQQSPDGTAEKRGFFGLGRQQQMPAKAAELMTQARANMPAMGTPAMGASDMGGRFGTSDRGENTKDFKKGGKVKKKPMKKMAAGGSASKRGDGCATKGKTKGRFV